MCGMRRYRLLFVPFVAALAAGLAPQGTPAYRNASLPVAVRVQDLLGRMTLEEKFWQLFMIPGNLDDPADDYSHGIFGLQISPGDLPGATAHAERINAIQRYFVESTRLGIPIIPFDEAVHGLARDGATMFPQAIALAATWDPALVARVAAAAARETGSRGIRQVLSPVVNIADDVRWGRVEETYGEDPFLASAMARAFVGAFERAGIITTPKHFVANVGEGGRDSYPIEFSERRLAERYFPPFEAAIREAGARSVMTAYNSVDGSPATQNHHLLTDILKVQWGFEGFVISDAAATGGATVLHMTEPDTPTAAAHAFAAGLDVVFQSSYGQQRPYLAAFQRGLIPPAVIDQAVARVLRAKFELGLFERPYVDPAEAGRWNGHADHLALARDAATQSIVLLRNERQRLPLSKSIASLAVIGADAVEARLGGYSAAGVHPIGILDGIRQTLAPAARLRFLPGPGRVTRSMTVVPSGFLRSPDPADAATGLRGEYFDDITLTGTPRLVRRDASIDFRWTLNSPGRGIPFDWYSARWTGSIVAPPDGVRRIGIEGNDGYRLYLDGRLVIDNWKKQSYGTRIADIAWAAGSSHQVRLEYFEATGNARLKLLWDGGVVDESDRQIAEAVALAKDKRRGHRRRGNRRRRVSRSRVAWPSRTAGRTDSGGRRDGHARDRRARRRQRHHDVAVDRSRRTPCLDAWYPGEQGGPALADILFGDANPSGRLPITFPMAEGQLPLSYDHKPTGRGDDYVDLTGMPLFPFGFGLSYTTFEYSALRIEPATIDAAGTVTVRCTVRNTGARAGDEVVQLYIRDELTSVAQPVMELRGFHRIALAPGESRDITFRLGPAELRMLDAGMHPVVEPGTFRVMIGASSKDIRLRGEFTVR